MRIVKALIISFLLLFCQFTFSQNHIKVLVKDSLTSETLVGATIIETGTTNGAITDINGFATLKITQNKVIDLSVRFIGYQTKNLTLKSSFKDTVYQVFLFSNATEMDEVIITSVRTNSHIEDIPTRIEVLGIDDMKEENGIKPGNILSILGDMAGIQMQQTSASSGNAYARIQGLNGNYTQILKDGIPLFGGLSGSFGILQIPPLDLHQIEIIKGSCATLYGGDAIGGIINLVSKVPKYQQELSLTINQTSLMETNFNLYASKRYKKFGYTLFAGKTIQKEMDIDNDSLSDTPKINSFVIHPKLVFYINPKSTITANYTGSFDDRKGGEMDYFKEATIDTLYHIKSSIQRHNADIKYVNEFSKKENLTVKLSSSFFNQNLESKYYEFDAKQMIYYSEVSYFKQLNQMNWVAGINLNGDNFENNSAIINNISDYNFQTLGVFVQNTYKPIEKLTIETGFRLDYHSKYDFFPLPRLSVMYKISKVLNARVNGGLGYKIPNPITYIDAETELNTFLPTSNLKPEHSQGINADINFQKILAKDLNININQSFFFTNINSPVYSQQLSNGKITLANANDALQTKGLQTYSRIEYKKLEFYLGYAFTDVIRKYDNIHPTLIATPKHNFSSVIVVEPTEDLRFGIESSYIATQLNQNYQPVKNYFLLAAMIQYNIRNFSFVLNGENLLDFRQTKYERIFEGSVSNPVFHQLWSPIDGRAINFSIKWSLKAI